MSRSSLPTMLFAGLVLVAPSLLSAQPAQVVDARQAVVDSTVGGLAIGGFSDQRLAQTVTVGADGRLTAVFLPVSCDSGELLVEIRDVASNEPGPNVLAHQRVRAASLPFRTLSLLVSIPFRAPLDLRAGDRIAIVLDNPSGSCGLARGPIGDSYGGGEGFFEALPNPPGWVPFVATPIRQDLPFLIEMRVR